MAVATSYHQVSEEKLNGGDDQEEWVVHDADEDVWIFAVMDSATKLIEPIHKDESVEHDCIQHKSAVWIAIGISVFL